MCAIKEGTPRSPPRLNKQALKPNHKFSMEIMSKSSDYILKKLTDDKQVKHPPHANWGISRIEQSPDLNKYFFKKESFFFQLTNCQISVISSFVSQKWPWKYAKSGKNINTTSPVLIPIASEVGITLNDLELKSGHTTCCCHDN